MEKTMANYGTVTRVQDGPQHGALVVHITGYDAGVAGSFGNVLNPEGCPVEIYWAQMRIRRDADAAATLDIGIGALDADETDLISAYDINGASHDLVVQLIGTDLASEGAATTPKGVWWAATDYLTFFNPAAANPVNFDACVYVKYFRMEEATL
jgi:hypothetical protein